MKRCIKDNSGFSLVEIIVALGISAFVVMAAYMLLNTASTSYSDTTEDIDGQREVMQSMNFIYDKLAESKDYRSYVKNYSDAPDGLVLLISNTEYDGDTAKDITSLFVYNPTKYDGCIYYLKVDTPFNALSQTEIDNRVAEAQDIYNVLAEDVKAFSIDAPSMVANAPIKVTVKVEALKSKISYSETKVVYSRNYQEQNTTP